MTACATNDIPDKEICKEIPFLDAPEGVCVHIVSPKTRFVEPVEWQEMKVTMLALPADTWAAIKIELLKGCRIAQDKDRCRHKLKSLDDVVQKLDRISKTIYDTIRE